MTEEAAGQRLDKLLRKALKDVPLSHVFKMLRTRKVRVNGARGRPEQLLAAGDKVSIRGDEEQLRAPGEKRPPRPAEVKVTFGVLFEDEHLLAVDKPSGLAAHPGTGITGATLVEQARAYLEVPAEPPAGAFVPSPAHRLDRETSGIVVVAKTRKAMVGLTHIFTSGEGVKKTYLALAKGKLTRPEGTIDLPLSEHEQTGKSKAMRGVNMQEAVTHWRVVSSMKEATLLAVRIETGRTHQIRRHLESVGHPVAGDRRYGDFPFNRIAKQRWGLDRMFLHAWKLELPHPVTGGRVRLEAPLPGELAEVLSRMNLAAPPPGGSRAKAPPAAPGR
ncbi:pseudouridine synthase [Anaeromyxobacter paludicola]|uniref:Pseudouridine synthase n=1 Tax=Anaeromyxobacter paludicola TaxID=2918171 RepID=A0ABM7XCZ8_9BACT|nr:pseudouridine synthase [Anaeromyxobacter paludicola]